MSLNGLSNLVTGGEIDVKPLEPAYKGATIIHVQFKADSWLVKQLNNEGTPKEKLFLPVYYHVKIDNAWYISFSESALKEIIDHSVAKREGKGTKKAETVEVNESLYIAPRAVVAAAVRPLFPPGMGKPSPGDEQLRLLVSPLPWRAGR